MDNKTNRGKLVRKYIGEEIEKFKFEYKGYQNDSWKYERKFKGVIQTISIYPYRFDQRMITFELYTDVKNSAYASEMGTNVIQAGMIEDITTNSEMRGYWKYKSVPVGWFFPLPYASRSRLALLDFLVCLLRIAAPSGLQES